MSRATHPLRRALTGLYTLGGAVGALFLVAILCLIVAQMVARWTGQVLPGSTDYAGYCMAAASFFSMAYALDRGAHIRVTLFLNRMGRWRRHGEAWCYGVGTALAIYFAWYAVKAVYWSHLLNDVSQGQDATPLWIPQLAMAIGTCLLAVALLDHFIRVVFFGSEGAVSEGVSEA